MSKLAFLIRRLLLPLGLGLNLLLSACGELPVSTTQGQLGDLRLPAQTPVLALPRPSTAPSAIPAVALRNVLVWEVKPAAAEAPTSYLVGTVHATLDAGYSLSNTVLAALGRSRRFFMEADLNQTEEVAKAALTLAFDFSRNNQQLLSQAEWQTLQQRLTALKVPATVMSVARPWYLNLLLESASTGSPQNPELILDQVLRRAAEEKKLTLAYLETVTEQLQALAEGLPEEKQLFQLRKNLAAPPKDVAAERDQVLTHYNAGDLLALERMDQEAYTEDPEYYQAIVARRNQKWLSLLEPAFKQEACLVAVGTLHLVGPRSLVALLQAQGWRVQLLR